MTTRLGVGVDPRTPQPQETAGIGPATAYEIQNFQKGPNFVPITAGQRVCSGAARGHFLPPKKAPSLGALTSPATPAPRSRAGSKRSRLTKMTVCSCAPVLSLGVKA